MKIFISWSGALGGAIGRELREWLPAVIQALKPYYSPEDITKGSRWNAEISKELEASAFGLIVTTKESLESAWVMFEAGALSKNLDSSRVIPILFGVDGTDVTGPLVQFQAAKFSKDDIFRTLSAINATLGTNALADAVLKSVFEMWWPRLDEAVQKLLLNNPAAAQGSKRSDRDILEELLALNRSQKAPHRPIARGALVDLLQSLKVIYQHAVDGAVLPEELQSVIVDLNRAVRHICNTQKSVETDELLTELLALTVKLATVAEDPAADPDDSLV